jgi:hypothetical protein
MSADEPERYRVEDLALGWTNRSYIKRYGWWAQLVLDEFDFLRDPGFSMTGSAMAGVHFHQEGSYVAFGRPDRDVVIEYDPETQTIGAGILQRDEPRSLPLDDVILERNPEARLATRSPVNRTNVEANVRWWAGGLRAVAKDVL